MAILQMEGAWDNLDTILQYSGFTSVGSGGEKNSTSFKLKMIGHQVKVSGNEEQSLRRSGVYSLIYCSQANQFLKTLDKPLKMNPENSKSCGRVFTVGSLQSGLSKRGIVSF